MKAISNYYFEIKYSERAVATEIILGMWGCNAILEIHKRNILRTCMTVRVFKLWLKELPVL